MSCRPPVPRPKVLDAPAPQPAAPGRHVAASTAASSASARCSLRPSAGWSSPTSGSLFILLLNAFWAKDSFTGKVEPFNWSLEAFETILTNPVY